MPGESEQKSVVELQSSVKVPPPKVVGEELPHQPLHSAASEPEDQQVPAKAIAGRAVVAESKPGDQIGAEKQESAPGDGQASHLPEDYNQALVKATLYTVFFATIFLNIDMGILPAGSTIIKQELKLNNTEFGTLGSVVYFGQVLGAALASGLLAKAAPKFLLFFCLLLNVGALLIFTVTDVFWILAVSRSLTGIF